MPNQKVTYRAYVQNENCAGEFSGSDTSIKHLKEYVRSRYGKGWNVIIERIESGEGFEYFSSVEVENFTLRK